MVKTSATAPPIFTVTVAERAAFDVFLVTFTLIEALPFPDPGVTVTHSAEAAAVQSREVDQLRVPGELQPAAPAVQVVATGGGAADWLIVITSVVTPAIFTVTVADRGAVDGFGAGFTLMEALPVPDPGETATHGADAVTVQALVVVTGIVAGEVQPYGPTVQTSSCSACAPAWVTLTTQMVAPLLALTVTVAVRAAASVLAAIVSLIAVAAPVPVEGVVVTHGSDELAVQAAFGVPVIVWVPPLAPGVSESALAVVEEAAPWVMLTTHSGTP
jgi:hypothetical protein